MQLNYCATTLWFLIFFVIELTTNSSLKLSCFRDVGFKFKTQKKVTTHPQLFMASTIIETNTDSVLIITPSALNQLKQTLPGSNKCLRIGVKSGGCSGLSYTMEYCEVSAILESDHVEIINDNIRCVIDPKSLLFIYGLQLDYSHELMGGGFKFSNPNAKSSCGCGKSFGV